MGRDEAWVTVATTAEDLRNAMTMAKSLRRVMSSRKLILVTDSSLPHTFWKGLDDVFDGIVMLSVGSHETYSMRMELYAKLYCWTLPGYHRCVFIPPNAIVLKNCDELFTFPELTIGYDQNGQIDTSLYVFQPSFLKFQELLALTSEFQNPQDEATIFSKIGGQSLQLLESKYQCRPYPCLWEKDISIVLATEKQLTSMALGDNVELNFMNNELMNILKEIQSQEEDNLNGKNFMNANGNEPIAVVGMTCRLPDANSTAQFWDLLMDDSCKSDTAKPFRSGTSTTTTEGLKNYLPIHYLSIPIDETDNQVFGITPAEMYFMDPQIRLLLEVVWEALEDAGIDPTSLRGSNTGVFTGICSDEYRGLLNQISPLTENHFRKYMGSMGGCAARVSHLLGVTGPSYASDVACTSSMISVHLACQSLRQGETALAVAGGVNLFLQPYTVEDVGGICSKDGRCKTFDVKADGFARGEGCGVLILKKYSDAIKDGDRIHGLIRGTGVVQEGASPTQMTPTVQCEALAMKKALDNAGVSPAEISYVEAHGTGTAVGDPVEIAAIAEAYSPGRLQPLTIASVKTNLGHTEGCSGITGIIKTILSLQNQTIPRHKNLDVLNPKINLDAIPAIIPLQSQPWPVTPGKPRFAGVSCFGITGTEAHTIIQEAPSKRKGSSAKFHRPYHILSLSAKTPEALEGVIKNYETYLLSESGDLGDIAYSANTGRSQSFRHRAAVFGKTAAEVGKNISTGKVIQGQTPTEKPKICFMFAGIGCFYNGMATELYQTCSAFRIHFDKCDHRLKTRWDMSLTKYLTGKETSNEDALLKIRYSQTFTFCVEYALFKTWESWGIKPDYIIGHSSGEIAGSVAAGMMGLDDAVDIIVERSRIIEELVENGGMIAVNGSTAFVQDLLKRSNISGLDFAAINSDEQTVLSGSVEDINRFSQACLNNQVRSTILQANHAFHSRHMSCIYETAKESFSKCTYQAPTNGHFISATLGRLFQPGEGIDAEYWTNNIQGTVRFKEASIIALNEGCTIFLELSPTPVLSSFMLSNCRGGRQQVPITCLPSLNKKSKDWPVMLNSLAQLHVNGFDVNWNQFDEFYSRQKVSVPYYSFQRKKFPFPEQNGGTSRNGRIRKSKPVHPLLGGSFSNATDMHIFEETLDLSSIPYIMDHKVGENVIFPGAGFLEMILAAGFIQSSGVDNVLTELPSNPITVENLIIETPLSIEDCADIQVILTPKEDSTSTNVQIFSKGVGGDSRGMSKWIRHTTGEFLSYSKVDVQEFQRIKAMKNDHVPLDFDMCSLYEDFDKLGLKFGPTFRSLKKVWKNAETLVAEINVPKDAGEYLTHPILTDGMIQAALVNTSNSFKELRVPIAINKFTWFQKAEGPIVYAFVYKTGDSENVALFDSSDNLLALMKGVSFAKTSVQSISEQLDRQGPSKLPSMYDEEWRKTLGPLEQRMDLVSAFPNQIYPQELLQQLSDLNQLKDIERDQFQNSSTLCYLYILNAFYQIGWTPVLGQVLKPEEFCNQFNIKKSLKRLVNRFFWILKEEGYLVGMADDLGEWVEWMVAKLPPTEQHISQQIASVLTKLGYKTKETYGPLDVVVKCGEEISNVFRGNVTAQELLFSPHIKNGNNQTEADLFYDTHPHSIKILDLYVEAVRQTTKRFLELPEEKRGILRILEVGAGTGSGTKFVLPILEQLLGKSFTYTFTDISAVFFPKAEKEFEKYKSSMKFKVLDMQKHPLDQGFWPEQFDLILGLNVFHICTQLPQLIRNLRSLTSKSGLLVIAELTKPCRDADITFGLFDDYWLYADKELRPNHCIISSDQWKNLLQANGYDLTESVEGHQNRCGVITGRASSSLIVPTPLSSGKVIVIFSNQGIFSGHLETRLEMLGKKTVVIEKSSEYRIRKGSKYWICPGDKAQIESTVADIEKKYGVIDGIIYLWGLAVDEERDQNVISLPFLYLSQILSNPSLDKLPWVYVCTQGLRSIGDRAVSNPSAGTLHGIIKVLQNELPKLRCKIIDMDPEDKSVERLDEVFMELWNDDKEFQVAYRNRSRCISRLVSSKTDLLKDPLLLPNSSNYSLLLPMSKSIKDLKFVQTPSIQLKETLVEIEVKASGLNFKDVLIVLKPTQEFEKLNSIGLEFAGVVTAIGAEVKNRRVGDAVFGWALGGGTIGSHVTLPSDMIVPVPPSWTFADAATLPVVFRTVYHCLVTVGHVKAGETILIHTGSGGVGLCAIQLAKYLGARTLATAGSCRKRAYLRSIGIEHVFESRSLEYGQNVLDVTGGMGVDLVLNSLTGPGFKETSLRICRPQARFIEMSKLDIWEVNEVASRRPDVKYTIVDVTTLSDEMDKVILQKMADFTNSNVIKPLPYTSFDLVHVRDALEYMQSARHIGKIVVELPQVRLMEGKRLPSFNRFDDRSTYLITGGYGGIGFAVAKWMANSGAKYIALVGRNKPNSTVQEIIESLNDTGKHFICLQGDVGDYGQCKSILEELKDMNVPPVRGVMHSAGVLDSAMIGNISQAKLEATFNPKVNGGWNLHDLTKEGYKLQHFVLFSSVVATIGNSALSIYAGANSFLDSLAHHRNSCGLPALSINWGQWDEIGLAAEIKMAGMQPMSPNKTILSLEMLMKSHGTQKCVSDMDPNLLTQIYPGITTYMEDHVLVKNLKQKVAHQRYEIDGGRFASEFEKADDKFSVVLKHLTNILIQILMLGPEDVIDKDETFQNLGLDSLMFVMLDNSVDLLTNHTKSGIKDLISETQTLANFSSDITKLLS